MLYTDKKIRVAFIFTHKIQYFINLIDELNKSDFLEILVIYAYETRLLRDPGFGRFIEWDNRQTSSYPESTLCSTQDQSQLNSILYNKLNKTLSDFQPDIIHLNGYNHPIQMLAWLWSLINKVPYFIRGDGDNLINRGTLKNFLRKLTVSPIVRFASKVMFQGEQNKLYWSSLGANSNQLIWIPCVPDSQVYRKQFFKNEKERNSFRSNYNVQPNDVVFVLSGKLYSRKRPADAIRAFQLCKSLPIKLWFLGAGILEKELKILADELDVADLIHWWGFQNQSQLPSILQSADVLLHTSQADPWPYSILEGAISGLALLLSDKTGSYPDWLMDPPACKVFKCGDIEDLAQKITVFATDKELLFTYKQSAIVKSRPYNEKTFCDIFHTSINSIFEKA
jgi:glycosyltransferase involved in cell wall biosynthesis